MLKSLLKLTAISSVMLLAGCEYTMTSEIYTDDAFAAANGETIMVNTDLSIEVGSKKSCEEKKVEIVAFVSEYYPGASEGICTTEGMKSLLTTKIGVSMARTFNDENGLRKSDGKEFIIFGAAFLDGEEGEVIKEEVALSVIHTEHFAGFKERVSSKFYNEVKPEEFSFNFNISNDTGKMGYNICSAYVDGIPTSLCTKYENDKRSRMAVSLSDIKSQESFRKYYAYIAHLKKLP